MKNIHEQLRKYQVEKNQFQKLLMDMAKQAQVICFDEFFVEDIALIL